MKKKLFSLNDEDRNPITVGLIRLSAQIPPYQFFYEINRLNHFQFSRKEDLKISFDHEIYDFLCMQTFNPTDQTYYQIIANKSFKKEIKTPQTLFESYEMQHSLITKHQETDYVVVIKNEFADFSLILLPENRIFPIQPFKIKPEELIYQYIEENE